MAARFLLVEDTPDNLKLMTYILSAYGHTVTAVGSGEAALAAAGTHGADLIIMDLQLPGIDGYETLRRLRADPEWPIVPVIAVTAYAMVGNRDQALAAGFDGYLTKPIDPRTFVPAIEAHLPEALRGGRTASPKTRIGPRRTPVTAPRPPRGRLLAIDDRRANLTLLRSVLEPHGYIVDCATDPDQALVLAVADHPDAILCDIHLGDAHGADVLRRLRADPELAEIPFAYLSATSSSADGPTLDGLAVIYKPIEPEPLLARVATLVGSGTARSTG